mmetsp:Transcript_11940/g.44421  ORF Transcript_11940/g.44421 Transcript_11940/m.44421 type:complete len:201 (+) Transcript_11940:2488-3090(+)
MNTTFVTAVCATVFIVCAAETPTGTASYCVFLITSSFFFFLFSISPATTNPRACASCSRISPEVRLPSSPRVPVAQNVQPILHPIWEETQSVFRPLSCRISTDSIRWPSISFMTNFDVPSMDTCTDSTVDVNSANSLHKPSRAKPGRLGIEERSTPRKPRSAAATAAAWMVRRCRSAVSALPTPSPFSRNAKRAGASKKE